jgi:uncharacterized membrane protein
VVPVQTYGCWHLVPVFIGFFITFVIGGMFWYLHHLSFHFINHATPKLIVANLVFLGFVSLVPFSMGLFSRFQGLLVPNLCYFGNFLGMSLGLNLHWWVVQREGLLIGGQHEQELHALTRRIRRLPIASVVGLAVSFYDPLLAMYAFVGVMLVFRFLDRWARKAA